MINVVLIVMVRGSTDHNSVACCSCICHHLQSLGRLNFEKLFYGNGWLKEPLIISLVPSPPNQRPPVKAPAVQKAPPPYSSHESPPTKSRPSPSLPPVYPPPPPSPKSKPVHHGPPPPSGPESPPTHHLSPLPPCPVAPYNITTFSNYNIGLVDREEGDLGPVYGFLNQHFRFVQLRDDYKSARLASKFIVFHFVGSVGSVECN